jgi:coproporphyrinogen III oxidase-like Fe-S oxidoreductase
VELDPRGAAEERLFTSLRRREGLARADAPEIFAACERWLRDSSGSAAWMRIEDDRARLTREGWLLSDAVVAEIIARLS